MRSTHARRARLEVLERRLLLSTTAGRNDPLGLYRTTAPYALGRYDPTFVAVDGRALFLGGTGGGGGGGDSVNGYGFPSSPQQASNVGDVYDAGTGQWSVTRMPHRRAGATAVAAGHTVVVAGGDTDANGVHAASPTVDLYDAQSGAWTTVTPPLPGLPTARDAVDGRAILDDGAGNVELVDVTTGQWATHALAAGPTFSVAVVGDDAYFFESNGVIETFHAPTGQWGATSVAPDADFTGSHAVVDGQVVFAGGHSDFTTHDSAGGAYDVASGQWFGATMKLTDHAAFTVVGDKVIFGAGYDGIFSPSADVAVYDAATHTWSAAQLSEGKYAAAAFTVGSKAYFVGGIDSGYGDASFTSDVYDDQTGQWSTLHLRNAVDGHDPAVVLDGQVVVGGRFSAAIFTPSSLAVSSRLNVRPYASLAASPKAFTWAATAGATGYDVYLDDVLVARVNTNRWALDRALAPGDHAWQVVSRGAGGGAFTAGPRWPFTVGAPAAPTTPSFRTGLHLASPPTQFAWAPSDGATSYDFYLDGRRVLTTAGTFVDVGSNVVGGGRHAWGVVARNGLAATPSAVWTFTTPVAPVTHGIVAFPGAMTYYHFQPVAVGGKVVYEEDNSDYPIDGQVLQIYDTATGQWTSTAMPDDLTMYDVASSEQAGLETPPVVDGQILYCDGATADVYDVRTGRWSSYTLPRARHGITVAVVGDDIVLAGGDSEGIDTNLASAAVDVYNARTGQWSTTTLSVRRDNMAAAVVGGKLVLAGGDVLGQHDEQPSDAVDLFDPVTGQWTSAHLAVARQNISVAVHGDTLFIAGGTTDTRVLGEQEQTTYTDAVDVYDATSGQWTVAHLSDARAVGAAASVGQYVLFAGGRDAASDASGGGGLTVVDEYDTSSGAWRTASLTSPSSRGYFLQPAVVVGDKAVLGGARLNVFDAAADTWSAGPDTPGTSPQFLLAGRKVLVNGLSTVDVYDPDANRWSVEALSRNEADYLGVSTGAEAVFLADGDGSILPLRRSTLDILGDAALVPQLVGSVGRVTLSGAVRAGDTGSAVVTVRNAGSVPLAGPIHVSVYASSVIAPGAGAIPLGSVVLPSSESLAAGASIAVRVPLIAAAGLFTNGQFIVAGVQGGSASTFTAPPAKARIRLDTTKKHGVAFG